MATQMALLKGLPPFPAAAARLLHLLSDSGYDTRDVVETLGSDPALAAKVLAIANSAMFRTAIPCISLEGAVRRLGSRNVRDVATAVSAMAVFSDARGVGRAVRDHSVGLGAILRVIAEANCPQEASTLFVAGLLHEVGTLLLLQTTELDYAAAEAANIPRDAFERSALGFDHVMLGSCVLKMWHIPDPLPEVVAWHHQPARAIQSGGRLGMLVSLLRVAEAVEEAIAEGRTLDDALIACLDHEGHMAYADLNVADLRGLWPAMVDARLDALEVMSG